MIDSNQVFSILSIAQQTSQKATAKSIDSFHLNRHLIHPSKHHFLRSNQLNLLIKKMVTDKNKQIQDKLEDYHLKSK